MAPLTSVAVVCAAKDGLATLAAEISAFIEPGESPRWTIEYACEQGFVHLLQRLTTNSDATSKPLRFRSHVFSHALAHAVKHGHAMALLECLFAYCPTGFASLGMEEAARLGKLDVLKWIEGHDDANIIWSSRFLEAAATRGHLETLEWLLTKFTPHAGRLANVIMEAMQAQQLAVVAWLFAYADKRGIKFASYYTQQFLEAACHGGSLEVVQFLHAERKLRPRKTARCIYNAIASGDLELIEWLYVTGYRNIIGIDFRTAAEAGRADILRWMLATYPDEAASAYTIFLIDAVTKFNGAVMRLLFEHKPEVFTANVLAKALVGVATAGDLGALEWLMALIRERTTSVASTVDFYYYAALLGAAENGHLAVVQWLFRNLRMFSTYAAECDEQLASAAAGNGHAEVVKWIHANQPGARRPTYDVCKAIENGHFELVQWMLANGHHGSDEQAMLLAAAGTGNLKMLRHVHGHVQVPTWPSDVVDSAASLEMVQWLHASQRCTFTTAAVENAAKRGDFRTLLFLREHAGVSCTLQAAVNAHDHQHLDLFQWLLETHSDTMDINAVQRAMNWSWLPNVRYWSPLLPRVGADDV